MMIAIMMIIMYNVNNGRNSEDYDYTDLIIIKIIIILMK